MATRKPLVLDAGNRVAELPSGDTVTGTLQSIQPGTGITVDNTDPQNPVVSATGGGGGLVPYNIPDGQSFMVPLDQQALFTLSINLGVGSSIILDGALVEVS